MITLTAIIVTIGLLAIVIAALDITLELIGAWLSVSGTVLLIIIILPLIDYAMYRFIKWLRNRKNK